MRPCFNTYCQDGKELEYNEITDELTVTENDCNVCQGTGEVEDYCYCSAYEPDECMCGAWDDVRDSWYNNECYDYEFEEEE